MQRQRLQRRRCRGRRAIAGQEKRAAKAADCGVADVQLAEAQGHPFPPLPSIARFGASVGADGCGGWAGRRRHRRAAGHAGGAGRGGQGVCGRRRRASSGSCRAGAEYRRKGMPSYARPCLVASKIPKIYKIFRHIEFFNACMKY